MQITTTFRDGRATAVDSSRTSLAVSRRSEVLDPSLASGPNVDRISRMTCVSVEDRISESARTRLQASAYESLRTLRCEHHEGVLVLRGRVSSFYLKQLAQEAVRNLHGVEVILNVVEVDLPNGSRGNRR